MTKQFKPENGGRGIEWCDETRNATGGCLHDCQWQMPDGTVAVCYAKELAESVQMRPFYPQGFESHYWRPNALRELPRGKEPLLIFCDSMSDMFAANVPAEHVLAILDAMRSAPHHVYQSLTKAAPQLLKYLDHLPPNLWVGVSSPPDWFKGQRLSQRQQEAMLRNSLAVLRQVREATGNIVWMSAEPVSWDLTAVLDQEHPLDWIVIGAASHGRKYFQPAAEHVLPLLELCDSTGTPIFYKGNIRALLDQRPFATAELNRWREDFPTVDRSGKTIRAVARRQDECRRHGWTCSRRYAASPLSV
jgi:protein gp37